MKCLNFETLWFYYLGSSKAVYLYIEVVAFTSMLSIIMCTYKANCLLNSLSLWMTISEKGIIIRKARHITCNHIPPDEINHNIELESLWTRGNFLWIECFSHRIFSSVHNLDISQLTFQCSKECQMIISNYIFKHCLHCPS